jgi:acyl carrier protein
MEDVQLLVVTASGELAGVGELGEIWVRSPHLAAGYLGDEALTAARFTANPFTCDPADRVYRTGDLGRYRPDGEVVFAGRQDQQVKIRGLRIELGEIEAALGRHPAVREAAVVVRGDGAGGDKRLAAYAAVGPGAAVTPTELKAFLWERLPRNMVPPLIETLEALPLTPNRKIDRRALAARPAPEAAAGRGERVAPASELETTLAAVWCEVLEVDEVGVEDNFFDLGGHSLLLVRLHGRLQQELGRELPLVDLFSYPTIRSLAEHLAGGAVGDTAAELEQVDEAAEQQRAASRRRRRQGALRVHVEIDDE